MKGIKQSNVWAVGLVAMIALVGCGKASQGEETTPEQETPAAPSVSSPTTEASLPQSSLEILDFAVAGVKSASPEENESEFQDGVAALAEFRPCSGSGLPRSLDASRNIGLDPKTGEDILPETDNDYVRGRFKCMINADTENSESIQGALGEARMSACMLSGLEQYDGQTRETTVDIAQASCLPQRIKDETLAKGITHVVVKVTGYLEPVPFGGAGWKRGLDVFLRPVHQTESMNIRILSKATNDEVALSILGGGTPNDAFSISLNFAEQALRYEAKFQRLEWAGFSNHLRLLVKGRLNRSGAFSGSTKIEGLYSQINGPAGSSSDINSGKIISIKDTLLSRRTQSYECFSGVSCSNNDINFWVKVPSASTCYGGVADPTCVKNAGILVKENADLDFIITTKFVAYR